MKQLICSMLMILSVAGYAQRRAPKMAPVFADGYYINTRNDTVRGEIQTNVEDETTFYHQFHFRKVKTGKPRAFNTARTKAYGYEGRHFELLEYDGEKKFVERLTNGRLVFYEYRFHGKIDGLPAIESTYYIRDTWKQKNEESLAKINNKFYKKSLKPFMKDEQPMIWDDLDKYTFSAPKVINAINEFNSLYPESAN